MSTQEVEMNDNTHPESGLRHGQFYVYYKNTDFNNVKVLVNPLSQDEIADGWSLVLPHARKNSTTHHFSVYLSQLPPHLWSKVKVDTKNCDAYKEIKDNIYTYSLKMSKHDDEIRKLYNLLLVKYPNIEEVADQYKVLQSARVKGWIMTRAHRIMHPTKGSH